MVATASRADGFTVFRSYSHHIAADLRKRRCSAFAAPTLSAYVRAHRHPGGPSHGQPRTPSAEPPDLRKPAVRTSVTSASRQDEHAPGKAEQPLTGGGHHPIPGYRV